MPLRLACATRRRKRRVLSEPTALRRRYPAAAERVENTRCFRGQNESNRISAGRWTEFARKIL